VPVLSTSSSSGTQQTSSLTVIFTSVRAGTVGSHLRAGPHLLPPKGIELHRIGAGGGAGQRQGGEDGERQARPSQSSVHGDLLRLGRRPVPADVRSPSPVPRRRPRIVQGFDRDTHDGGSGRGPPCAWHVRSEAPAPGRDPRP
jgi:hypothetical protein